MFLSRKQFEQLHGIRLLLLCLLAMLLGGCRAASRPVLTLSVAASLHDAIIEVEAEYTREHSEIDFRNNFGSSGTLAREIEQGAPVDALLSAGSKPMDQIDAEGLLMPGTRANLLKNRLVLVAPKDSRLGGFAGLTGKDVRLIALGEPSSVPAGQYGREALTYFHLYDNVSSKLVLGKDVRQVLTYVETGNADAGLVYSSDALLSTRVRVVAVAPDDSHDPIVYPIAVVKGTRNEKDARAFLGFLTTPAAQAIFLRHGFTMASS
jgi:molybdate transport system substrate-binding protein